MSADQLVLLLLRRKEVAQEAAALLQPSWSCHGLVITIAAAAELPTTDNILPPDTKRNIDTDPGRDKIETVAPSTKIGKIDKQHCTLSSRELMMLCC